MDFSWRSFAFGFRLPLKIICVELLHYMSLICVLHELGLRLVFGFELLACNVCELCWFMLLLSTNVHLVVARLC